MPATISEANAMIFRPNKRKLELVKAGLSTYATANGMDAAEIQKCLDALERRPLVRFFVMRAIEDEMAAAGIDWDGIGDFFVKIAPILIELIKMFF